MKQVSETGAMRAQLRAVGRWEEEACKAWFQGPNALKAEHPGNFRAGFVGTWANNTGLLSPEEAGDPEYRIMQSALTSWWQVMMRCAAAGLAATVVREWLDQAQGRHYADALSDAALGVRVGPFEFQAKGLTELFSTNSSVDPVLCVVGDPDSASAHAERMIADVMAKLNGQPPPARAKRVIQ